MQGSSRAGLPRFRICWRRVRWQRFSSAAGHPRPLPATLGRLPAATPIPARLLASSSTIRPSPAISNSGTISARQDRHRHRRRARSPAQISDSGNILASAHGILIDSASKISGANKAISITGPTFTGGISNAGTLAAANTGIIVSGVTTFAGGIANSGTINGNSFEKNRSSKRIKPSSAASPIAARSPGFRAIF